MSKEISFSVISKYPNFVCRPAGFDSGVLPVTEQFWKDSYGNIRFPIQGSSQESNLVELIHDAFQPLSSWNGFEAAPSFQGVMLDTHIYQMFSNQEVAQTQAQHIAVCTLLWGFFFPEVFFCLTCYYQSACGQASNLESLTTLWKVVGEWTIASTDCATYLNGRGIGSRYAGTFSGSPGVGSCNGLTGSGSTFSTSYKTFLRQFYEAQVGIFLCCRSDG